MNMLWTAHTALVEDTFKPGSEEDQRFLALALAGEVGELANIIKKQWRGDNDPEFTAKLEDEIGDVYAYLRLLAMAFNVRSPSRILDEVTLPKIKQRWPHAFSPLKQIQPTPTCAGGADISTEECPLCGATPDQRCPHNESHS